MDFLVEVTPAPERNAEFNAVEDLAVLAEGADLRMNVTESQSDMVVII